MSIQCRGKNARSREAVRVFGERFLLGPKVPDEKEDHLFRRMQYFTDPNTRSNQPISDHHPQWRTQALLRGMSCTLRPHGRCHAAKEVEGYEPHPSSCA